MCVCVCVCVCVQEEAEATEEQNSENHACVCAGGDAVCPYRFFRSVDPLKALLGTAWMLLSLRSLRGCKRHEDTQGERDRKALFIVHNNFLQWGSK